jgi:predicted solute-binding protein
MYSALVHFCYKYRPRATEIRMEYINITICVLFITSTASILYHNKYITYDLKETDRQNLSDLWTFRYFKPHHEFWV